MQAIVWLETPIKCADNGIVSALICNIEEWNANDVEVIFPEGQKLSVKHSGLLRADSIESAKWLLKEPSGELMAGAWDISFSD